MQQDWHLPEGAGARDTGVPFYAALTPTIDWAMTDGVAQIAIEERAPTRFAGSRARRPRRACVREVLPQGSAAANPGFDVTPARLVTGIITERGVCPATTEGLRHLFPELAAEPRIALGFPGLGN